MICLLHLPHFVVKFDTSNVLLCALCVSLVDTSCGSSNIFVFSPGATVSQSHVTSCLPSITTFHNVTTTYQTDTCTSETTDTVNAMCPIYMGGGWFPKLVWPKHNMINQQVKVGVANNDKRAGEIKMLVWHRQSWCGNGHTCHTAFSTHAYIA